MSDVERERIERRTSLIEAGAFAEYQTEATPAVAKLLRRLAESASVVLDLGSGRDPYLPHLSGDVICLDIFPSFLRDLPRACWRSGARPSRLRVGDTGPHRPGVADLAFASELVEHLQPEDARRALQDWPGLARRSCVIDTPNGHEGELLTRLRHLIYRTRTLTETEHPSLPELDHHTTFSPDDFRSAGYDVHGSIGWVSRKRFRFGPLWDLYDAVAWRFPAIAGTLIAVSPGRASAPE